MTRLIDANALKKENERLLHCDFPYLSETTLEELIDDAPTIDAVPVIRCKDCKYYTWYECQRTKVSNIRVITNEDDYCSRAERRGEE